MNEYALRLLAEISFNGMLPPHIDTSCEEMHKLQACGFVRYAGTGHYQLTQAGTGVVSTLVQVLDSYAKGRIVSLKIEKGQG